MFENPYIVYVLNEMIKNVENVSEIIITMFYMYLYIITLLIYLYVCPLIIAFEIEVQPTENRDI